MSARCASTRNIKQHFRIVNCKVIFLTQFHQFAFDFAPICFSKMKCLSVFFGFCFPIFQFGRCGFTIHIADGCNIVVRHPRSSPFNYPYCFYCFHFKWYLFCVWRSQCFAATMFSISLKWKSWARAAQAGPHTLHTMGMHKKTKMRNDKRTIY